MSKNVARHNFPPELFPITVEALHPDTRAVVWTATLHRAGALEIPPLKMQLGHPVAIRMTFGDGSVNELDPD